MLFLNSLAVGDAMSMARSWLLLQIQLDIIIMNLKNGKENKFLLNVVFLVEGTFEI